MFRRLIAIGVFLTVLGPTLSVLACEAHPTTAQSTAAPQTMVQTGTTPMTPIPPVTPKTGG
jgi:hypothetical protein